jgi:nucleotide-binding universal stress UspA family protein
MSFGSDLNTILVATDGSPSAREASDFAVELAAEHGATLLFVHVVRTLDFVNDDPEDAGYAVLHEPTARDHLVLEEAAARAAELGVDATTSLRFGTTVEEIVAYADACNVDVIVVGTRGHGRVASALLGSVSLGVMRKSTRPVLIVRGGSAHARGEAAPVASPAESLTEMS